MWYSKEGLIACPKDGDLVRVTMAGNNIAGVEILSYGGPLSGIEVELSKREGDLFKDTTPLFINHESGETMCPQGTISEGLQASRNLAQLTVASAGLDIDKKAVIEGDKVRVYLVAKPD